MQRLALIAALSLAVVGCTDGTTEATEAPTVTTGVETNGFETDSAETTTEDAAATGPRAIGVFTPPATLVPRPPEPPEDGGQVTGPGERSPAELAVGECLDLADWVDSSNSEQTAVTVVSCEDPHDAEVFARVSLNDDPDSPYPGDEHVVAAADRVCFDRFEGYVGMRYVDARLEIVHLRPPRAAWIRSDRHVICILVNANLEPLVGSLAADP